MKKARGYDRTVICSSLELTAFLRRPLRFQDQRLWRKSQAPAAPGITEKCGPVLRRPRLHSVSLRAAQFVANATGRSCLPALNTARGQIYLDIDIQVEFGSQYALIRQRHLHCSSAAPLNIHRSPRAQSGRQRSLARGSTSAPWKSHDVVQRPAAGAPSRLARNVSLPAAKPRAAKTPIMHLTPHPRRRQFADPGYPVLAGGGRRQNWLSPSVSNGSLAMGNARRMGIPSRAWVSWRIKVVLFANGARRDHEGEGSAAGVPCRGCLRACETLLAEGDTTNCASGTIHFSAFQWKNAGDAGQGYRHQGQPPKPTPRPFLHVRGRAKTRGSFLSGRFDLSTWTPCRKNQSPTLALA